MRTTRVMRDLLLLFCAVMVVAMAFAVTSRVRSAFAAEDRATVTRSYFAMSVRGQVNRHRRDVRAIRVLRRELKQARTVLTRTRIATRQSPYGSHPIERNFLCIHGGEGAWNSNTGNGYYGGLQMDRQFQATYGPEFVRAFGTADNWPVSVQLAVGMRAYLSGRGFHPWPTTSRACGLL